MSTRMMSVAVAVAGLTAGCAVGGADVDETELEATESNPEALGGERTEGETVPTTGTRDWDPGPGLDWGPYGGYGAVDPGPGLDWSPYGGYAGGTLWDNRYHSWNRKPAGMWGSKYYSGVGRPGYGSYYGGRWRPSDRW